MAQVPLKPIAPRFHILGPGGIGSLFAYYFHQHHIPFTFFQRRAPPPQSPLPRRSSSTDKNKSYPPRTLKYMNLSALSTTSVEPQVIDGIHWEPLYPIIDKELFRYDPVYNEMSRAPIHQLLVTTKTYQTVEAISKIRHRLRPWTTIVLMQNGMGVREEICESMGWTDNENERPNFVQGIISHGAQKVDDTIVHTGRGHVWLAPIADIPSSGYITEDLPSSSSTEDPQQASQSPRKPRSPLPDISSLLQPSESGSMFPKLVKPPNRLLSTAYPYSKPATFIAPFTDAPFSSFYEQPSTPMELRNLRTRSLYETLAAFQQLSTAMDLEILMPEHLLAMQLSKLVVNSCVNPVATLLESTNGTLLDSEEAHQAVKDLIKESQSILSHSKEFQGMDEPLRQEFLTLEALTKTTETILRATKQNRCSTLQDYLKGSQQCEIDYMNGYLIKMADRSGCPAPLNRMVTEKIKEKFAAPRKNPSPIE
ncbi:2-dehydropantoate 2-reductase (Ketopantoate reductase) (KPA reductase) (KPR) [Mortierella sp. GBA30]|nr:2-dehydropantoate 2-reductase (Ketopantoate reductase) (KPA reductase) (KPR) [Mortierella sp. GBA30]